MRTEPAYAYRPRAGAEAEPCMFLPQLAGRSDGFNLLLFEQRGSFKIVCIGCWTRVHTELFVADLSTMLQKRKKKSVKRFGCITMSFV